MFCLFVGDIKKGISPQVFTAGFWNYYAVTESTQYGIIPLYINYDHDLYLCLRYNMPVHIMKYMCVYDLVQIYPL